MIKREMRLQKLPDKAMQEASGSGVFPTFTVPANATVNSKLSDVNPACL